MDRIKGDFIGKLYQAMFKESIEAVYLMPEYTADLLMAYDRSRSVGQLPAWHKIKEHIGIILL